MCLLRCCYIVCWQVIEAVWDAENVTLSDKAWTKFVLRKYWDGKQLDTVRAGKTAEQQFAELLIVEKNAVNGVVQEEGSVSERESDSDDEWVDFVYYKK
jgi:hypothetical protein